MRIRMTPGQRFGRLVTISRASAQERAEPDRWHDVGYLMAVIDAAIEDGFDPDEDGPLLDEIRAELASGRALTSPAPITKTAIAEHGEPDAGVADIRPDHAEICVGHGLFAKVDWADWEAVKGYRWHTTSLTRKPVYALANDRQEGQAREDRRQVYMHLLVFRAPTGMVVDHINGDALDNRRANLRAATREQNAYNSTSKPKGATSIYKGVSKEGNLWRATIRYAGQQHSLGRFQTEVEAAAAYNEAAKVNHGEFAVLNDISLAEPSRQMPSEDSYVLVPRSAIGWLLGETTDADGKWFGEVEATVPPLQSINGRRPTFWWRSHFRSLIAAAPSQEQPNG